MSLLRCTRSLPMTSRRAIALPRTRTFAVSARSMVGKESAIHEDSDKRAQEAENTKQEELAKQKKGKNEWREEIASDSESAVKADKGHLDSSKDGIKKMQDETKGKK